MKEITTSAELDVLLKAHADPANRHKILILDFWAPWCRPCVALTPFLTQQNDMVAGLEVIKTNVDDCDDYLQARFKITSMPTLVYFVRGKYVDTTIGSSVQTIQETLHKHYLRLYDLSATSHGPA